MNCTAPEMIPTLACRVRVQLFFILLLLLLLLIFFFFFFFFFNESATKRYIDRGRHRKSDWKTKGGGAGTDEGWGEKGNHFGVEAEKKMGSFRSSSRYLISQAVQSYLPSVFISQ